jgi:hypothetical protein
VARQGHQPAFTPLLLLLLLLLPLLLLLVGHCVAQVLCDESVESSGGLGAFLDQERVWGSCDLPLCCCGAAVVQQRETHAVCMRNVCVMGCMVGLARTTERNRVSMRPFMGHEKQFDRCATAAA